ncbi:MAG: PEGA domain-containing protein [Ignavibacteriae bacterium]|nr:PEGA domain-containing protein [Ignavibacteriota bacterium]
MNNFFKIISSLIVLLLSISCDKKVSVSEPYDYEISNLNFYIKTIPAGASIFVDDRNISQTAPDTIKYLTKGSHKFTLKLDKFLDYTFNAYVSDSLVKTYEYNFYEDSTNFGSLKFESFPPNCDIYLNNILQDYKTPYLLKYQVPDKYKVKYTYDGYASDSTYVFVYPGRETLVNIALADTSLWVNYNSENSVLSDNYIKDILVDNYNKVWIATSHNGIFILNGNSWKNITSENSELPSNVINKISKQNLNIWIATNNGLVNIIGDIMTVYTSENSELLSNYITDVEFDSKGNIWVGTQNGLSKFNGESWQTYRTSNSSIPGNFITCVEVDKTNNIWVGTNAFSTGKMNNSGNWQVFQSDTNSKVGDSVKDIISDSEGNLWIGLATILMEGKLGGIFKINDNIMEEVDFSLPEKHTNNFYQDINNTLWIATKSGLLLVNSQTDFNLFTTNNSGLPTNDISSIGKDLNGNIWIGTNGGGVVKYKKH